MKKNLGFNIFLGLVILAVGGIAVAGLVISGSPAKERLRRFDETRVNQLQQLTFSIESYANMHDKTLPSSLEDLKNSPGVYVQSIQDPEALTNYEYRVTGTSTYDLCATFASATPSSTTSESKPMYYGPQYGDFWNHPAGYKCFSLQYTPAANLPAEKVPQTVPVTPPPAPAQTR